MKQVQVLTGISTRFLLGSYQIFQKAIRSNYYYNHFQCYIFLLSAISFLLRLCRSSTWSIALNFFSILLRLECEIFGWDIYCWITPPKYSKYDYQLLVEYMIYDYRFNPAKIIGIVSDIIAITFGIDFFLSN